jgi:tetratricopeptide (TPR) repeat protein
MPESTLRTLLFSIIILLACSFESGAQTGTDEKLANQYFQNKEFDKALLLYEKLFDSKGGEVFFEDYLACFIELQKFDEAEKLAKKQIRKYPGENPILIQLGYVYLLKSEKEKALEQFDKVIKQLRANDQEIRATAQTFQDRGELDYAIKTYEKGRRLFAGLYPYHFELADVYAAKKDIPKVFNEYIEALNENEGLLQNVQNALQTMLSDDSNGKKNEFLKQLLIKKIQENGDRTVFSDLLIWQFIQEKDFESAFQQSKALDKRFKEEGQRVMNLAALCRANQAWETAIKCLQYVISKGDESGYYIAAKMDLVEVMNKKITQNNEYTSKDLADLETLYTGTIKELGKNQTTGKLIRGLAHLETFYLNKPDSAISILEDCLTIPNLNQREIAETKLELGDALVFVNEVWDASLYYSQAEKMFKNDPIGQEAKLRNAKLSYYKGEFEWAQAQLNVLKSATSQLIANDALYLALLIGDNLIEDSTGGPLILFAKADLYKFQNRDDDALKALDSINPLFPDNMLKDDILFIKAQIAIKHNRPEQAALLLDSLFNTYPDEILADDALFKLAELNQTKLNNKAKAQELYQEFLLRYPGSMFTVEARKRFRELRGDRVN